jgi:hypothetical protein
MTKWLAVSAMLLSQAVWVYAQNGWVICIHSDGEARTEPAGDSCCDAARADRPSDDASGPWIQGSDDCACSDYALSFTAPQITRTARIDIPVVQTIFLLPNLWTAFLFEGQLHFDLADHGPPRAGPLDHLETVVLRI